MKRLMKTIAAALTAAIVCSCASAPNTHHPKVGLFYERNLAVVTEHGSDATWGMISEAAGKFSEILSEKDPGAELEIKVAVRDEIVSNISEGIQGVTMGYFECTERGELFVVTFDRFVEMEREYGLDGNTMWYPWLLDDGEFMRQYYVALVVHEMVHAYLFYKGVSNTALHEYLAYALSLASMDDMYVGTMRALVPMNRRYLSDGDDDTSWINDMTYGFSPPLYGMWSYAHYVETGGYLFDEIVNHRFYPTPIFMILR